MKSTTEFAQGDYNVFTTLTVGLSPRRPSGGVVTFAKGSDMSKPKASQGTPVTGMATPGPVVPSDNVTKRRCDVGLAGADGTQLPLLTLDVTSGPATFPALVGQTYSATFTDTNANGDSLPSAIVSGTVDVGGNVPTTPTGGVVTFALV